MTLLTDLIVHARPCSHMLELTHAHTQSHTQMCSLAQTYSDSTAAKCSTELVAADTETSSMKRHSLFNSD